mmetsp:Transcript_596/g.2181  ORF Transcript_596/g.2181 Transcript_596/m.2181 type:complete len:90 (+) Transcript_596:2628-2897(+)
MSNKTWVIEPWLTPFIAGARFSHVHKNSSNPFFRDLLSTAKQAEAADAIWSEGDGSAVRALPADTSCSLRPTKWWPQLGPNRPTINLPG